MICKFFTPCRFNIRRKHSLPAIALTVACAAAADLPAVTAQDAVPRQNQVTSSASPVVQETMKLAAGSPADRAKAIATLSRLGSWTQLDRVLRDAAAADDEALALIAAELGGDGLIRVGSRPEVSDASKALLAKAAAALTQKLTSPERLRAALADYLSADVDRQIAGGRSLLSGGDAAIAIMVDRIMQGDLSVGDESRLLRLLARFGDSAADALLQVAIYGSPEQRTAAIGPVTRLKHPLADVTTLSSLHGADTTPAESQRAATIAAQQLQRVPSRDASIELLHGYLTAARQAVDLTPRSESTVTLWIRNTPSGDLVPRVVDAKIARARTAADIAASLRRFSDLPPDVARDVLATDVAYRVLIDPDWGSAAEIDQVLTANRAVGDAAQLQTALGDAIRSRRDAAAVGLLRVMRDWRLADPLRLLLGNQPSPTTLVAAASDSVARIRYEAVRTIDALDPDQNLPYAGSTEVQRTRVEMGRLSDLPQVILIETRPQLRSELSAQLNALGYRVVVVGTAMDAVRAVMSSSDPRFVISKTQLWDMSPVEMVDRVRRTSRGRTLPIIVYTDDSSVNVDTSWIESARWPAITEVIDLTAADGDLTGALDRIERSGDLPPLDRSERIDFRN